MKKRVGALIALTALAGCGVSLQPFTPDDGGFTVRMPANPRTETRNDRSDAGPYVDRSYLGVRGAKEYRVGYMELRDGSGRPAAWDRVQGRIEGAVQGVLRPGVRLINRRALNLDGHPGVELDLEVPAGVGAGPYRTVSRFYVVGPRLYTLIFADNSAGFSTAEALAFLDSFALRGAPPAATPAPEPPAFAAAAPPPQPPPQPQPQPHPSPPAFGGAAPSPGPAAGPRPPAPPARPAPTARPPGNRPGVGHDTPFIGGTGGISSRSVGPDGRLDPADRVDGEWLGFPDPDSDMQEVGGDGRRVIGLHARQGAVLDGLALVMDGPEG